MSNAAPKPWVQFACVCEKALREADNVASLIRIVDTYYIDPQQPLPPSIGNEVVALPLTIALSLKSGEVTGEHEIQIRLNRPNGKTKTIGKWPVRFAGDESGMNLIMGFALLTPEFGLYWFDVLWGEEILARIPLRVKPRVAETVSESSEIVTSQ